MLCRVQLTMHCLHCSLQSTAYSALPALCSAEYCLLCTACIVHCRVQIRMYCLRCTLQSKDHLVIHSVLQSTHYNLVTVHSVPQITDCNALIVPLFCRVQIVTHSTLGFGRRVNGPNQSSNTFPMLGTPKELCAGF